MRIWRAELWTIWWVSICPGSLAQTPGSRSAGRVQSVALRLICDRELEIETFKPEEYWQVKAQMGSEAGKDFETRLYELNGKRVQKFTLTNKEQADTALEKVRVGGYKVTSVDAKPIKRNPPPPFTTSTLQQEASRKLGYNASRTMGAAQKLYEAGFITYMRTDGVEMAEEAYHAAREAIGDRFGNRYVPEKPRRYSSKAKKLRKLTKLFVRLISHVTPKTFHWTLNWSNFTTSSGSAQWQSQMATALLERTTVDMTSKDGDAVLRATGQVVKFDGFLTLYQEGKDDAKDDEDGGRLPAMAVGERRKPEKAEASQHFTEPPPRYSEASLVKKMEELGIGRPSTYASTLGTLRDRDYVVMEKNRFIPRDKGRLVTVFLEKYFHAVCGIRFHGGAGRKTRLGIRRKTSLEITTR